ncbi:MAG: hypothetical protein ABI203_09635 [Mucilaginibacter sp.]
MKTILSKAVIIALISAFISVNLQAATLPLGDTTKMSKMKMEKKMEKKKMDKMKMKKKMAKDTMGKM